MKKLRPFIILFKPREFTNNCTPSSFTVSVLGDIPCPNNIDVLEGIKWELEINGCDKCSYKGYCRLLMDGIETKCLR